MKAFLLVAMMHAKVQLAYRSDLVIGAVGLLIQIVFLRLLWKALLADGTLGPLSVADHLTYVTLAQLIYWTSNPSASWSLPERVRDGSIVTDLSRPIAFVASVLASQLGSISILVPFAVVGYVFASLVDAVGLPASTITLYIALISSLMGILISVLLASLINMTAFWTTEVSGLYNVYALLVQVFSGALIPLWVMPGWLESLAYFLPFQATVNSPVQVYLETAQPAQTLLVQGGWILALSTALWVTWSRVRLRVTTYGG